MISAGVLEGTVFLGGYSGDRFFVAESLVGVHYLKRGKLLNSILDIVLLLIFASACAFVGTFAEGRNFGNTFRDILNGCCFRNRLDAGGATRWMGFGAGQCRAMRGVWEYRARGTLYTKDGY